MDFGKEVGKKADEGVLVEIELDKDILSQGISKTISKTNFFDNNGTSKEKAITIYLKSVNPLPSTAFKLTAYNSQNLEIGRSKNIISFEKDDAKYVDFIFDKRTDLILVKKYFLEFVK